VSLHIFKKQTIILEGYECYVSRKMSESVLESPKSRPNKVEKGGRSIYCCIPECGSAIYDYNNKKTGIGFFKFPKEKVLRQRWIRSVNQVRRRGSGDNFRITDYTRVCEFHFNRVTWNWTKNTEN